jgi:hypothetical protein
MFAKPIPFRVFCAVTMPEVALGSSVHKTQAMAQAPIDFSYQLAVF